MNGSLQSQLDLLNQIQQADANETLAEGREGFQEARKQMTDSRRNYMLASGLSTALDVDKDIYDIALEYEDEGVRLQEGFDGTYTIWFTGDASQAEETLQSFL